MPEFEITFLGTGTSHGIPVIGCECAVCRSTDPRDKRLRTAALIRTPDLTLAIDTPPDFRTQCLRENIRRLDAVLYTHAHCDHVLGFDDLRRFCEMQDMKMPVYGSEPTMAGLQRVFQYAFDGSPVPRNYIRPDPHLITGPFRFGDLEIVPVELPHGRTITTGFVFIRKGRKLLAYMTDCNGVPDKAVEVASGAEVLVVGALRHHAHSSHHTVEQALASAERIRPGRTLFIHMCHDLGHEETERALPDGVRLAYDGLRISL